MAYRRQGRQTAYRARSSRSGYSTRRRTTTRRRRSSSSQRIVIQLVGPRDVPGAPSPLTLGKKRNLPVAAKY